MKTNKVNNDVHSSYNTQRNLKAFRLGAIAGGSIAAANSVFHHKDIADSFSRLAAVTTKNKAFAKTGAKIILDIGLGAVFYGLLNTTISSILDFITGRNFEK